MKYYACQYCSLTTYSRKAFIRHQTSHTGVWPFTCEVCGKGFSERFQALKHVQVHHFLASNHMVSEEERVVEMEENFLLTKDQWNQHCYSNLKETEEQVRDTIFLATTSNRNECARTICSENKNTA
ncbi:zinc finger protein-like, partial [Tropilaelaps mercedesae]